MSVRPAGLAADRMAPAYGWRFAYLLVQGGTSLLLFGLLAHVLGRAAFSTTAVAQGLIVIAFAIADFGLAQAAVTVLPARIAAAAGRAPELLAGAADAFAVAAVLAALITLAAAAAVPHSAALSVALVAPAAAATTIVSGADGLLRAQGEFRRPVLIVAASGVAAFAAVPVAAATGSPAWTCVAISAGTVLGALPAFLTIAKLRSGHRPRATADFARAALPLGCSQLLLVLATRADTLLGGLVSGLGAAAAFEATWRVYQLGQYALGAFSTGAAPFIADAFGAGRTEDALGVLRQLMARLVAGGCAAGLVLYLARVPLSRLTAGSIAATVGGALLPLALVTPLAITGTLALYTLVGPEGHRRWVLIAYAAGSALNLALAAVLAPPHGAQGLVTACAAGLALTNIVLLGRLTVLVVQLRRKAQ